ncbi:FAS-associated factor 2-like isoform X2 [Pomacea canaliculata]|uniref:FAS-associated factor 2-like isoform X2 n=1 Tax=Pomacea canaliculata TaxID=400727 RepID=UPI000D731265|nr:FAS-associated factor 2-like isoform X2 [Pomacea canaliculata]
MADGDDLSQQQTDNLLQFQDLTGIEDIERCRTILERHNWNIETAVQDTFNEQEGAPTVFSQQGAREARELVVNTQPFNQRVISIQRQQPAGLWQWSYYVIFFPIRFVWSTVFDVLRFFFRLLRPDPRRNVTDPLGDVLRFISQYESKYGSCHPVFYQGTYSQALNDAKRELRFLLVYLHGDDHQDTDSFCQNTLADPQVCTFLNTRTILWACNTGSPEGYRVSQALKENTYPFLAVIVLRENRMTVVAKIEGPIGAEELMNRLEGVMRENEVSLIAARAEREERNFNQTLRQQQDEAYLESLRADQEKERRKREERQRLEEELQKQRDEEARLERIQEERQRRKEELALEIPPEPDVDHPDAIRIVLKTPNGKRLERRFLGIQSSKSVQMTSR